MAAHGILLAVAVHDKGKARLERAVPASLEVDADKPLTFRVSYALRDSAASREGAKVSAMITMKGQKPIVAEVRMRDRPVLDDSRLGDLVFEVPPLAPGDHVLHYVVSLQTSDASLGGGRPHVQGADIQGDVAIFAAARVPPAMH